MATTISTDLGDFAIYHVTESGNPSVHDTDGGEWFFQPADVNDGEAFSSGYPTEQAATAAALAYVANETGSN